MKSGLKWRSLWLICWPIGRAVHLWGLLALLVGCYRPEIEDIVSLKAKGETYTTSFGFGVKSSKMKRILGVVVIGFLLVAVRGQEEVFSGREIDSTIRKGVNDPNFQLNKVLDVVSKLTEEKRGW